MDIDELLNRVVEGQLKAARLARQAKQMEDERLARYEQRRMLQPNLHDDGGEMPDMDAELDELEYIKRVKRRRQQEEKEEEEKEQEKEEEEERERKRVRRVATSNERHGAMVRRVKIHGSLKAVESLNEESVSEEERQEESVSESVSEEERQKKRKRLGPPGRVTDETLEALAREYPGAIV